MDKEELLYEIAKKLNLEYYEYESLVDDVNNLRGGEWLEEVEGIGDEELTKLYKKIALIYDWDDVEDEED